MCVLPPPPTGQPKEQKMGGGNGNSGNGGGVPDPESAPMMQTDVLSYLMLICSEMVADSLFFSLCDDRSERLCLMS